MLRKPNTTKKTQDAKTPIRTPRGRKIQKLKGMKDVLFDNYKYWDLVINKATDLAKAYSFKRIQTPVLESALLYDKSTGKVTDIVSKEMYTFIDKNGDKVAIRPEATPGLVRAYVEHGMFNMPQPVRMFWLGSLFRHEKPQAGRLREHTQFDLEMFGDEGPVADAQLILIAFNFFKELQINVHIHINSIGCTECRKEYVAKLIAFYKERGKRNKLCVDCRKRLLKSPLRLLDCKEESCMEVREDAPQFVDFLCDGCRDHFMGVLENLDEMEVPYNLNPYLVRGLDYYNRTVFEIIPDQEEDEGEESSQPKRQISMGGGGRYDKLVEQMGGHETPALGFGIGLERVILKIKELHIPLKKDENSLVFVAQLGEQARAKATRLFEELRRSGYAVRQLFVKGGLKAQFEEANRIGAKFSLILGQKEVLDGTILLRDMESGIQEVIDFKKISVELDKRLAGENK